MAEEIKPNRRVMIASPSYDGRLEVWYTNSLIETIRQGMYRGIDVFPIWVSYDALIQRARNDSMGFCMEMGCDDLVWIDSDIEWNPDDFFKLLEYPVDIVGGTYRKKGDEEQYVVKMIDMPSLKNEDPSTGLVEVAGLGTGFLRMSRNAVQWLWDNSPSYVDRDRNIERKLIFDIKVENGNLISEDIWVCERLRRAGFKIWFDKSITCGHIGTKKFSGDFNKWLDAQFIPPQSTPINHFPNTGNRFVSQPLVPQDVKTLYK